MMQKVDPKEILSAVRAFYGRKARKRTQACCGPESRCRCSPAGNYPDEELAGLPGNLADVSLGCGNPVSEIDIRPGDTVLDPFAGSFTTCAVARKLGRKSIGIEINEEYIKMGIRRLSLPSPYSEEELVKKKKRKTNHLSKNAR